ncbi:MAG: 4Fe-4S binding protein [Promethearchaeota archaeon]
MMRIQKLITTTIQHLMKYPNIGKACANFFGYIEVPILEFRRVVDKYFRPGFYNQTSPVYSRFYGSRIIPIKTALEGTYTISPTEEILEIIKRIPVLAIGYCYCRTIYQNCNNPKWTCIHVGKAKKLSEISKKTPLRSSNYEEVEKILRKADELGLVHQLITAPNKNYFYVICNCCPCCCTVLRTAKRISNRSMIIKSHFIAVQDENKCKNCKVCVSRCYFNARVIINDKMKFYQENCVGCGLCVSSCSHDAIELKRRRSI